MPSSVTHPPLSMAADALLSQLSASTSSNDAEGGAVEAGQASYRAQDWLTCSYPQ